MKKRKVIIVGGGASGMIAAITAARGGSDVTIIEKKDTLGKKILATGNGKCNLTNEYMEPSCFRGEDITIVSRVLNKFGAEHTKTFFSELGVMLKEKNGYVYPLTEQASTILKALILELEALNVHVVLGQSVLKIKKNETGFTVKTDKDSFSGDSVILATGGKASPSLGSDGSGYHLAKSLGHSLLPVVPALVQLKGKGRFYKQVAGVRTQAKVSLYVNGVLEADNTGELQLTNYGISGIPVFQVSRFAAKGLFEHKKVEAEIDFLPSVNEDDFFKYLKEFSFKHSAMQAADMLSGIFNSKLIGLLLRASRIDEDRIVHTISEDEWKKVVSLSKHFRIEIEDTNGFEQAQVCAGGVRTSEVNQDTMESIYVKDLYLTGELLDVDGICGGYNLQWAWATGYLAGKEAAKG